LAAIYFVPTMRPQEIIAKKRDGKSLSREEIDAFVAGVSAGDWADYQSSAMLMAMFIRGLDVEEQTALTHAMLYSGAVLDLSKIERPKADKHSTGGVGDKTSLIVAPLAASCGLAVPMISGRGLGHTGGTLDKLESIAGYNVNLTTSDFERIIGECGFAMMGQTAEIAPADKKLYAIRDATATVPYIPLIVASIMSKKLAEGLDALVLDVKTGSGAFMPDLADSKRLAEAMVATGNAFDVETQAVVSDMGQPLGKHVGNASEVYECIKIMRGEGNPATDPTRELSLELAARMLLLAGVAASIEEGRVAVEGALTSGRALECFRRNVELQGGDPGICDDPRIVLNEKLEKTAVTSTASGFIAAVDTYAIGDGVCGIGGGRVKTEDGVDHAVGYSTEVKIGDRVQQGDTLGFVYCRTKSDSDAVLEKLRNAYKISEEPVEAPELIRAII
jgi:pyrimidine-nucleoside phosphorylase